MTTKKKMLIDHAIVCGDRLTGKILVTIPAVNEKEALDTYFRSRGCRGLADAVKQGLTAPGQYHAITAFDTRS